MNTNCSTGLPEELHKWYANAMPPSHQQPQPQPQQTHQLDPNKQLLHMLKLLLVLLQDEGESSGTTAVAGGRKEETAMQLIGQLLRTQAIIKVIYRRETLYVID